MRCRPALLVPLLILLAGGCAGDSANQSRSWYERANTLHGPTGSDVVQIDIALLEQPLGNRFLNEDLWALADEQFVSPERKILLAENGFHAGIISGITPPILQALLTSERSNPNPREKQMRASNMSSIELGPPLEWCHFHVKRDGGKEMTTMDLQQVQCTLQITPTLGQEGLTSLRIVPRLVHGASGGLRGITAESLNWLNRQQPPVENFDQLTWDVSLATNEYLVIGGRYDRRDTLGHACFIRADQVNPVQRLLVLRATRVQPEASFDSTEQMEGVQKSPPLALQAAWTTSRGSEPLP